MKHYDFTVRELLDWEENDLWNLELRSTCSLKFDDGEEIKKTNTIDVVYSWYYWQVAAAHRSVNVTRELFLDGRVLTDDVHRELLYLAIKPTIDDELIDREDVWLIAYRHCYNALYNALATRLKGFVSSTDVPDILELINDPEIKEANDRVTHNPKTVDRAYDVIKKVLFSNKYPNNPIVEAVRNGTVPLNQILQSIGPRGRVTDIDSEIFNRPITRGFAHGFMSINDFAKETRSAAKALLFNTNPVAIAEYFNRKLQLVCSVIGKIEKGDCGTPHYHELKIPELTDDKNCSAKAMLKSLAGLYMICDDGSLKEIRASMTELAGTRVRFRTTMCCKHLPNQGVCRKCYGVTSYAIPHDTNPGHVSCTAINKRITQLIISTKHLDFIVHTFRAFLRHDEAMYLDIKEKKPECLYIAPGMSGRHVAITFPSKDAPGLVDAINATDFKNVTVNRVSSLSNISFDLVNENGVFTNSKTYDLTKSSIKPSFSRELLRYIKRRGWTVNGNNCIVHLDKWKAHDALLVYPLKHDNMSEFGYRVERFIRSSTKVGDEDNQVKNSSMSANKMSMLTRYHTIDDALYDAYYLISEKLSGVHMGHIATVLAATRVNDMYSGDFHLPSGLEGGNFAGHDLIIKNRSLSVAMLYEKQYAYYDELDSYLLKDRPESIMDDMVYIPEGKYAS